ncbi:hypothetical protein ACTL32_13935 [Planococcus sp. FY231025]|uniref:hypothetical protein n=1 Tax=Planococcus sp. FY231025 TaxID=3455699 RepID=UPI003F8E4A98
MEHQVTLIDYAERGTALYIQAEVFDAGQGERFREEVRFLGDLLYGDLVHPEKSPLTQSCRLYVISYLKTHFNR